MGRDYLKEEGGKVYGLGIVDVYIVRVGKFFNRYGVYYLEGSILIVG